MIDRIGPIDRIGLIDRIRLIDRIGPIDRIGLIDRIRLIDRICVRILTRTRGLRNKCSAETQERESCFAVPEGLRRAAPLSRTGSRPILCAHRVT